MDFKRLNAMMIEMNISNVKMGESVGATDAMVGRWRKGEAVPKADKLGRIADVLECSADYLLGRSDDPVPGGKEDPVKLSEDELELLTYFRGLTGKGKRHVLNFAESEADAEAEKGEGSTIA